MSGDSARVLINGGGIAGLSAAIALSRRGMVCEVIETAPGGVGAAISFSGSQPIQALTELGVLDRCLEHGRPMLETQLCWYDAAGELVHSVGPPGVAAEPRGLGIFRPVLLDILGQAAAQLGVSFRTGPPLVGIDTDAGQAMATFVDGSCQAYDLVVGADGIYSTTRALVFPGAPEPAFAGQGSIRWMAPGPPIDGPGSFYNSEQCLLASYPLPQGMTYVATTFAMADNDRVGPDDAYRMLDDQLGSFTAPYVVALRQRLEPGAEVIYRPFESVLVPNPWFSGPVVLIGDAAHATTAHMAYGGAMALEDGVVLGRCLADGQPVLAGLGVFMRQRFARAAMVVGTSVQVSQMEQEGRPPGEIAQIRVPAIMDLEQPYWTEELTAGG